MSAEATAMKAAVATVGGLLASFALAVGWSNYILHDEERIAAPIGALVPRLFGSEEIGIVDQTEFELEGRAGALRAQKQRRLDAYGWVDRDAGIIHVPIVHAMDEVVRELGRGRDGG